MTEVVNAPEAAEATPATAEATPKAPKTTAERINGAMSKDMPAEHEGFVEWMKAEADIDIDAKTVLATQSLYSAWRQTPEFAEIKANKPAKVKADKTPQTKDEAVKMLKQAEANQARAAERAAKIKALLEGGTLADQVGADVPAEPTVAAEEAADQDF